VTEFAKRYLAQPLSLIIVGKGSDFLEALKNTTPNVRVIEQKDLDLSQPGLAKTK
jgi:hypothetical protein